MSNLAKKTAVDSLIRPLYDDSLFHSGLCWGEPMDVSNIPLKPDIIAGWVLEIMQPGKTYKRQDIEVAVNERHQSAGGLPSQARRPLDQFNKALTTLEQQGMLERPREGYWRRLSDVPEIPIESELEDEAAMIAEVSMGEGPETIYGWYFPAYRKLAELEGADHFPIKVGRTVRDFQARLRESGGMAPEKPVLGFVLKVHNSSAWERFIHSSLELDGRRLEGSVGNEWFDTNLKKLREIVEEKQQSRSKLQVV